MIRTWLLARLADLIPAAAAMGILIFYVVAIASVLGVAFWLFGMVTPDAVAEPAENAEDGF